MADNTIYDTANQLERDLRGHADYRALREAYDAIEADEASKKLFDTFRETTQMLQMKQMSQETPTDEEIEGVQALSEEVMQDAKIQRLMESEQRVSQLINDINQIIMQPLNEIYQISETN
ncbi:hypothetical protein CL176_08370 [Suicoccus acidiformans]|uniref:UPF0342 protein CL176_08370 n=1 Tax=Suicoccus acidiformans TaxID=2036206 RepID=A0A347WLQ5_9LACT|nr:YlbF family regulator [Suicoccus acidiformans]AXY26012.1 hypothetical protein CL176_08370 [Suicoccus acidiformans]